jgi:hypothetical protein
MNKEIDYRTHAVMLDDEKLLAKGEREKLLRQIEQGLSHSREIIAQIDNVRRNRSGWLAQEAAL